MIDWSGLEAANAPLNAFCELDRTARSGDGALASMTIGVKANIAVAGLDWTAGTALYRDRVAETDAPVVARLRAAGATICGTLNMEEAALGAKTDNPWYGRTDNPHRRGFTPGGSSGGSGAAVAAGLCDAALGTDTLGSVRIPAAYCGVYGFKPANAAVSQVGLEVVEASLDAIGPLARSLATLEAVARAMSAFGDAATTGAVGLAGLGGVSCPAELRTIFDTALAATGAEESIALPHSLSRVRFAGFIKASRALSARFDEDQRQSLSEGLLRLLGYGERRERGALEADDSILAETRDAMRAAVADGAVVILPTAPQTAFAHDDAPPTDQADFTCVANIAGLPALTIPAGWSATGLPYGVQLIGKPGAEAGLFAMARRLDATFGAYREPAYFCRETIFEGARP